MKTTTCNKCGTSDLTWRMSAKGKWYLSDPKTISTLTHGNNITIPFAHKCEDAQKKAASLRSEMVRRFDALSYKAFVSQINQDEVEELEYLKETLFSKKFGA